jgi:hypothetical protein
MAHGWWPWIFHLSYNSYICFTSYLLIINKLF